MSWLGKLLPPRINKTINTPTAQTKRVPEGVWLKCPACEAVLYNEDLAANLHVCPKCDHHMRLNARARIESLLDIEGRVEIGSNTRSMDPLKFKDSRKYPERIQEAMRQTGESDALIVTSGSIHSVACVLACFEFEFMGGSMGSVVGERFVQGVKAAIAQKVPFICVAASGGARMHVSGFSLMQMAKTSAALARLDEARGLFISVLADPTTGGVTASFAMLGDVIFAEPRALIGFAGPRVIKQTIRQDLPEGFQTSEFLVEAGFVDRIVHRKDLRSEIGRVIDYAGR
jgi:acetyl-CoA carboxylase carboxyl transferase subunit beta